jgi:uncharacterized protein (DUF362 family)
MSIEMDRRTFLAGLGAAGGIGLTPRLLRASAPTAPVAVAKCTGFGNEFLSTAGKMFDQIGGLGRLVKGKTVAIKINLTGTGDQRFDYLAPGRTYWTHPRTVGAVIHLLDKAGAKRIRVLEGAMNWPGPLAEFMYKASWDPNLLLSAAPNVELINTNLPYPGKKAYTRFKVPNGGHLFPAYDLNTAYDECDVMVSMAKLKEHATAGITLGIKNCFGMTPCTIYGNKAGEDEPFPVPYGGRQEIMHTGSRQPTRSALPEKDPSTPRDGGYRLPRIISDLVAARPVHLTILDGIETISGAELPRFGTRVAKPNVMVIGANVVSTDAVAAALMGFDPMADRGTPPFERCDNTLALAEDHGVGTRDLKRIVVIGTPIQQALYSFRNVKGPGPQGVAERPSGRQRPGGGRPPVNQ